MLDWKPVMRGWSKELTKTELASRLADQPKRRDWLGSAPATTEAIDDLESRLGLKLPPSYRAFLSVSDGWRRLDSFIGRLRPAAEVDWFVVENEQWAEAYADSEARVNAAYLSYTDDGLELSLCGKHTKHLVQISDVDDGVIVLNPTIQSASGEWEAWFFANWIPGAQRYASFAHLMLAKFRSMRSLAEVKKPEVVIPAWPIPSADAYRVIKVSRQRSVRPAGAGDRRSSDWERLIEQLAVEFNRPDKKLVRMLFGKLRGRPEGQRSVELTERLTRIFEQSQNAEVRSFCVQAITEFAPDGPAPRAVRQAYDDPDVNVMLSAVFSHHYFPLPDAVDVLCRQLARDVPAIYKENMISMLGHLADPRAIPALRALLFQTSNDFHQTFGSVGVALGNIGTDSFDLLSEAASHADPRVRRAAATGLDICGDKRAALILKRLAADKDPEVSMRAKLRAPRGK